mmetsp:Transcript_70995/g.117970  ORF Transcript_70995/g.117970 Transcript_70995/m.117970 type:complete len:251 (-) Transcript_70995:222-974(-)
MRLSLAAGLGAGLGVVFGIKAYGSLYKYLKERLQVPEGSRLSSCEPPTKSAVPTNVHWHQGAVSREERWQALGQKGVVVWLTGLSGSGKSTVAFATEQLLLGRRTACYVLDGDNLRHGLNSDLGFSPADRAENVRRVAHLCRILADAGLVVLACFISPTRAMRQHVRDLVGDIHFAECFVDAPLATAEARDPKGLYKKARAGEIKGFTGIDSPFEPPEAPELRLPTAELSLAQEVEMILSYLQSHQIVCM